jgi:hypothetical protein
MAKPENQKTSIKGTKGDYWAKDLKGSETTQYSGEYIAANISDASVSNPGLSWANPTNDPKLLTVKSVEGSSPSMGDKKIEIEDLLKLASSYDGDIDGVSNKATSICKEGEESFIYGASYTGVRGLSLLDIGGIAGYFYNGERIFWIRGDAWAIHHGTIDNGVITGRSYTFTNKIKSIEVDQSACSIDVKSESTDEGITTNNIAKTTLKTTNQAASILSTTRSINNKSLTTFVASHSVSTGAENTNAGIYALNNSIALAAVNFSLRIGQSNVDIALSVFKVQIDLSAAIVCINKGDQFFEQNTEAKVINTQVANINNIIKETKKSTEAKDLEIKKIKTKSEENELAIKNLHTSITDGFYELDKAIMQDEKSHIKILKNTITSLKADLLVKNIILEFHQ